MVLKRWRGWVSKQGTIKGDMSPGSQLLRWELTDLLLESPEYTQINQHCHSGWRTKVHRFQSAPRAAPGRLRWKRLQCVCGVALFWPCWKQGGQKVFEFQKAYSNHWYPTVSQYHPPQKALECYCWSASDSILNSPWPSYFNESLRFLTQAPQAVAKSRFICHFVADLIKLDTRSSWSQGRLL